MENGPLRVADAETLRAFAHPLRLRILSDLSEHGRSNVVGVAERLGEPANSVSYHLSILARHGLVVAAEPPEGATRRERWWQTGSTTGFAVDAVDDESRPAVVEALTTWSQQRAGEVARRLMASEEEAEARGLPATQSGLACGSRPRRRARRRPSSGRSRAGWASSTEPSGRTAPWPRARGGRRLLPVRPHLLRRPLRAGDAARLDQRGR